VRRATLAIAAVLALVTAARLPAAWTSGNALNHVSGVWMALADDLARGTLYRPIHAPDGAFGGTRYFPLAFALHAGLLRARAPLLAAGYAASLAAGLLLAAGLFLLLRALGRGWLDAGAFAALAIAGFSGQHALAAVRGDLLPVALSALGLAAIARRAGPRRVACAAGALALAFAAKPTALAAALAAVLFLALRGAMRSAAALAALVGAGAVVALLATDALSRGRFLAGLAAAATAGADARSLLRAPIRLAEALAADPSGLVLALAAAAVLALSLPSLARAARVRSGATDPRLLPALWLAAAWCGALVVFATPGTGVNHLVELEAASAALLGVTAVGAGRAAAAARAAAPVAAAAGLVVALGLWRADLGASRLAELRAVVAALPPGPIVSEDPLVPLLAGGSPLVLDPFTLRLTAARAPEQVAPLAAALRRGAYPAVVLFEDLERPAAQRWYADGNVGLPLVTEIRHGYRRAARFGRYHLYLPRAATDAGVVRRDGPG